jgi:hypothetical protein
MKRLWLLFSQAVTVVMAIIFVVATLKPQWLDRRPTLASIVPVFEAPTLGLGDATPGSLRVAARQAAALCASRGSDIAKLALQFSLAHGDIATTVAGSANPNNIRTWAKWAAEPIDSALLAEVLAIFAPVKNIGHREGLPENN